MAALCLASAALAWVGGCMDGTAPEPPPSRVIVSDPSGNAAAGLSGALSLTASAATDVAYISLPPGAIPNGTAATIRNARTGTTVIAAMVAGGLDPVAVEASVGDTIELLVRITGSDIPLELFYTVPATRRPIVVRTDPPPRKRDVPLNASLLMVFSEPIDPQTLTGATVQLWGGEVPVAGRLEFRDPDHVTVAFVPEVPLANGTDYRLVITQGIGDLDGEVLETPVTVEFTTVSVDTRLIAFVTARDGNQDIYVIRADGASLMRLTDNPAYDTDPAWSPDGRKLAFVSRRDGNQEIYVMNADGSAMTQLTSAAGYDYAPAWSPDGSRLAFVRDGEIHVMNADGSGATRLTYNSTYDYSPRWSPDGAKIAFTSSETRVATYVMNADGSGLVKLNRDSMSLSAVAWSPVGAKLAGVASRDPTNRRSGADISVVNADGSGFTWLTSDWGFPSTPAWSSDGRRLVYVYSPYGGLPMDIYVMNADGSGRASLVRGDVSSPAWSPDGAKIAFVGSQDGVYAMYVMNADGSGVTRLIDLPGYVDRPAWSPAPAQ